MTGSSPIVLGLDTSSAACRVAVLRGDTVLAERCETMTKGQAERLIPLCEEVMRMAGVCARDLDVIGVGIGPGNFTGIRIAVSAARGLALGLGVPAIGISAFDALRFGTTIPCACAVDARRDDVYLQVFDANGPVGEAVLTAADSLPPFDGPLIGHGGVAPAHPVAVAICHLAQSRLGRAQPRPAPL